MTNNPVLLFVAVSAAIGGIEVMRWIVRGLLSTVPLESILVVLPMAVRLSVIAFVAVRMVAVLKQVQQTLAIIDTVGR